MKIMACGSPVTRFIGVDPDPGLADRASADGPGAKQRKTASAPERGGSWLAAALAAIWVGLLLFFVAYVTVKGEAAISEFDALDLSAYSNSPP